MRAATWPTTLAATLCAAMLAGLPPAGSAQPAAVAAGEAAKDTPSKPPPGPASDKVSAAVDDAARMTVPVRVDGRGPYPFVIDTGADRTVISRELADSLGLRPGDPVRLSGTAGVDLTPTARIGALAVGAREMRTVSAPTLAEANLGADGLLGVDSLRNQRMVMDFVHNLMLVEPSKREHLGLDVIVVHARSRYGQLVLVDASIDGAPIMVIVDSGAQNTIGNLALRRLVGGDGPGSTRFPAEVVSVSGRVTPAQFANLPKVKVGGITLNHLPIAFADLYTFKEFDLNDRPAMLLGMDVLRHFDRVVVDFGRREVSFRFPVNG